MNSKEEILARCRNSALPKCDMPALDDILAVRYPDPLAQFITATRAAGADVHTVEPGTDLNALIRSLCPDARQIASNLPEVTIANRNPDTADGPQSLNGTDVGVVRGMFGVAENGCIWIPQTMKEKVIYFISEQLVILLPKSQIVHNMHEAYQRIADRHPSSGTDAFDDYGYGTFISGPSKTADIAQVLVMGAQAARSVTVLLMPE